jgi:hypothetical protein
VLRISLSTTNYASQGDSFAYSGYINAYSLLVEISLESALILLLCQLILKLDKKEIRYR